jgi:hypothetical protein
MRRLEEQKRALLKAEGEKLHEDQKMVKALEASCKAGATNKVHRCIGTNSIWCFCFYRCIGRWLLQLL